MQEAEEILKEIYKFFKFDNKVNNLMGIIKYINGEYEKALIYIGLSKVFREEDFDSTYNLALILQNLNKNKESLYYYNQALMMCSDKNIKNDIIATINLLK